MILQQVAVIATVLMVSVPLQVFGQVIYKVPCDYSTPSCECPLQFENGTGIEVCEFEFEVSLQHTFTRYQVNTAINTVATGGRLWIINDQTGEFEPHPSGLACNASVPINSTKCTEPFAVDGYTFRTFIAINGRIPGPTLIVNYNQTVSVNVFNNLLEDAVSIHWHGLDQRKTNFMDGVEHVTQCGAAPRSSFRYIFQALNTGTYWYHSHTGAQRTDGLFGSLVIKETPDLIAKAEAEPGVGEFIDQPDKYTLSFLDWQVKSSDEVFTELETGVRFYDSFQVPNSVAPGYTPTRSQDGADVGPVSYWSGLINGKGRHESVSYTQSRLSIFTVSPGKQYRFRLVGAQNLFAYRVAFAEHKLKVFAMDGTLVKPREVDFIIIHAGERYDFLLDTNKTAEEIGNGSFPIWGRTLETSTQDVLEIPDVHIVEGILHYDTTPEPDSTEYEEIFNMYSIIGKGDCTIDNSCETNYVVNTTCTPEYTCLALNCPFKNYPPSFYINCIHVNELELLFPLEESELPDVQVGEEETVILNFAFGGSGSSASINARTHVLPSSPLTGLNSSLLAAIEETEFCKYLDVDSQCDDNRDLDVNPGCVCTHVQKIPYNRSIQMVFSAIGPDLDPTTAQNFFAASHPIHLHGHQFHVVDIQFGEYNEDGMLTRGNDAIACGGTNVCTNPSWVQGRDYSIGRSGKISSTAPRKDTIFIPAGGYVVVYIQSDNPGYWYLHCHIEVHQLQGMAIIINEAEDEQFPVPSGTNICGNFTWSLDEFYEALAATPGEQTGGGGGDDDDDIDRLALGLGVGLGSGLLLSLIVNVILFILFLCCCCIKRDKYSLGGA